VLRERAKKRVEKLCVSVSHETEGERWAKERAAMCVQMSYTQEVVSARIVKVDLIIQVDLQNAK
jgi:hypothetical protein